MMTGPLSTLVLVLLLALRVDQQQTHKRSSQATRFKQRSFRWRDAAAEALQRRRGWAVGPSPATKHAGTSCCFCKPSSGSHAAHTVLRMQRKQRSATHYCERRSSQERCIGSRKPHQSLLRCILLFIPRSACTQATASCHRSRSTCPSTNESLPG